MPESQKEKPNNNGVQEPFWGESYSPHRYRQDDGTTLPLYEQVLIEATCVKERFDPNEEDHRRALRKSRLSRVTGD